MSPSREPFDAVGLSEAEARRRLAEHGPNIIRKKSTRGLLDVLRGTLREPMFLFLIAAAALYLFLGDIAEGLFMTLGAAVTIGLVVIQEARSERALAALQEIAEPFARVVRDGAERRIPARDLVPGDVILVGEGERLPADAALAAGDLLTVDESALTGESVPVTKEPASPPPAATESAGPGGDGTPFLYAGTLVVRGQGTAVVLTTGLATALGKIGAALATIESEPTLLQRTSKRLIARLSLFGFVFCVGIVLAYGLIRGDWVDGALAGITLAIALLPEEFPMVLAVFMALGSWRLARHRVLVRRAAVIETLGAATMLCVDKTGTLTENRMAIAGIWSDGGYHIVTPDSAVPEGAADVVDLAALASAVRPTDPMDRAVRQLSETLPPGREPRATGPLLAAHPLRPGRLAVIHVHELDEDVSLFAAKGAPEAIFGLCRMDLSTREAMHEVVGGLAEQGLRVLGVASATHDGASTDDPDSVHYRFAGLIAFLDPLRADVPQALNEAKRAGIGVAMITGDYPQTALEIARQAGIDSAASVLTGQDLDELAPDALRERLTRVRVFARVRPEQKLALVEGFKANGEVVAMTGDGINDAPALEASNIGIAMGERGTDVARESADLVLLDDSFASIVGGVRLGRRIFANLRKALVYVTAVHIPTATVALLPILFGLSPVLYPMHVILMEMVIDPVCSLVFEAEPSEKGAMEKPPRPANEGLFGRRQLLLAIIQGVIVSAGVLLVYVLALDRGIAEMEARGLAFATLVGANLVLAFADSAEAGTSFFDPRRMAFWGIGLGTAAMLAIVLFVPPAATLFQVSQPSLGALAAALGVALVAGGWFGFLRRLGLVRLRDWGGP